MECRPHLRFILDGDFAALQAPMSDGLSFDPFTLPDDGCGSAEVGVGRRHVVQALVVAPMVVVLDERLDLGLKVASQEVVLQQYAVLRCLVPALDLALFLGMHRGAAHMAHVPSLAVIQRQFDDLALNLGRDAVPHPAWR